MYRGFSMVKYKRIMEKLNLNAPTHKANITISYTISNKTYNVVLRTVPIIFDIQDVSSSPVSGTNGNLSYVTRKYQVIVHKDYFENQVLTASDNSTIPMQIQRVLAVKDNTGYVIKISLINSLSLDEEGYLIPQFEVNYGDYSDGGYRQYLELNTISTVLY